VLALVLGHHELVERDITCNVTQTLEQLVDLQDRVLVWWVILRELGAAVGTFVADVTRLSFARNVCCEGWAKPQPPPLWLPRRPWPYVHGPDAEPTNGHSARNECRDRSHSVFQLVKLH
jgi:hypothetical protein